MKITQQLSDEAVLQELGGRLSALRLARNMTQSTLAEQAGISKRTVERIESGAVQMIGLLRVCRVLGVLEAFDALLPQAGPGRMEQLAQLKKKTTKRQRASCKKGAAKSPKPWTWGESLNR